MSEASIFLRKASLQDLDILTLWDQQPHVKESHGSDNDWKWEEELSKDYPWRELFIAHLNDEPIGFIQIIDPSEEESHYWGSCLPNHRAIDIWIGQGKNLNKGYGTKMMQLAIDCCFSNRLVHTILIDPLVGNTRAIKFYKRLGFEYLERRILGVDESYVMYLKRDQWSKHRLSTL